MNCKKNKTIIIFIVSAICFLLNNNHVKAEIKITMGEKCALNSIYKDADSVEDAVASKMIQYLDTKFGTSQLIKENDSVDNLGTIINTTVGTAKYCPVYCVETDTFTWPGFKPITQMGEHFTWTVGKNDQNNILSGLTVNLTGKRECRNNIDLTTWQDDYNKIEYAIDLEETTLVKNPSYNTICLPKKGSRGCGYIPISSTTFNYSNLAAEDYTGFKDNNGASTGDGEIVQSGLVSGIHSNKTVTITTISGYTENSDGTVNYAKKVVVLETLCPCDWYPTGSMNNPIKLSTGTFTEDDEQYYTAKTQCNKGEKITHTDAGAGISIEKYKCSATASTVCIQGGTRFTCNSSCNKLSGAAKSACCSSLPKQLVEYCNEYQDQITVTSIQQEKCNADWAKYNYDGYCQAYGPYCPTGYYLAKDASGATKCYRRDTSILSRLLEYQNTMQTILKDCTNISNSLELDTEMKVDFEEPVYDKTVDLTKTKTVDKAETMEGFPKYGDGVSRITGASCTIISPSGDCRKIIKYQKCSLGTGVARKWCWEEIADITSLWIAKYGKVFTVEYEYKLPSDFYKYVLIPSGKSVNKAQASSNEFGAYQNFIDVGFPNYPVHYTTPTGTYNLDILYKNIGYQDHFTPYITTNINADTKEVTYDCEYDVETKKLVVEDGNEDESEFGGIRLVYRPISLTNPFPSMLGSGRKTGINWCSGEDENTNCANTNSTVEKYILDNRNTSGSEVYNKEPMYKVVLTPALIKEVREYNNDTDYDDYNLYCEDGHKCQSEFIKTTFQGIFEGCGASNDFDYCDSIDGYQR